MASSCMLLLLMASTSQASVQMELAAANPIRKVVSMLQSMEKTIIAEGEKEHELYEKFMCYCKTSGGDLQSSISAAKDKLDTLPSTLQETKDKLKATKEDLKSAKSERAAAKATMAEATGMREKEAAAFAATKAEYDANIGAINKAVAALEKGMGGSFLQSGAAQTLRHIVADRQDLDDDQKEALSSFLTMKKGDASYAPQSGSITGILKTMGDEMSKSLADATASEEKAIAGYEAMIAAKTKEVAATTAAIEKKTKQSGDLGVEIVQMEDDLDDTGKALLADQGFLKDMVKTCATKSAQYKEQMTTRGAELTALADTIKILNNDDALELFKKTLPAPSASFLQVRQKQGAIRASALAAVRRALKAAGSHDRVQIDLIAMVLHGRKIDFAKVIKMVDDMVALLKQEQKDDEGKKQYCDSSFDQADDKKKALEKAHKDAVKGIAKAEKAIETLTEEVAALEAGISKLDKEVAEATEQRQAENQEYKALVASDTATKELLVFAKNRLNKFYNPKLYKPPAKAELSSEGRIVESFKLVQISQHVGSEAAPPPAPETADYSKKGEESTGVIAMIDLLIADMDKEMTEAGAEEKDAQADYEAMIEDSKAKRSADSKSIAEKNGVKADMEAELEAQKGVKKDAGSQLFATLKFIDSLHGECDFLLQYYDVRREARTSEIQSLTDAKAVLSGADFSLLQRGFLRGRSVPDAPAPAPAPDDSPKAPCGDKDKK